MSWEHVHKKRQEEAEIAEETTRIECNISRAAEEHRKRKLKRKIRFMIVLSVITAVVIAGYVISLMAERIFGEGTGLANFINRHILNRGGEANPFLQTMLIILLGYVIITWLGFIIRLFGLGRGKRRQTIVSLIASFTKYIGFMVILVLLTGTWNVDPTIVAAVIAALGIAIGFGAQGLIGDMLAGLFLIFENALRVGDFVTFDDFRGEVVEVGVRATRICARNGNVKVINNSELRVFINMSMHRSAAVCDIPIHHSEDFAKVEKIITDNLLVIADKIPAITEGPWFKGIVNFDDRGMVLRIVAKCSEDERPQTIRDMNREIKLLFDKKKIKIAVSQREIISKKESSK
ncbi:MAG: mechanosensitive ion channel family protein [Firmicutes bacterium]|nr:mechanosensitive ion channel family protein [Bacillota bacterium]